MQDSKDNTKPTTPPAPSPQEQSPISYKDMIAEAFNLSRQNSMNILRTADILHEVTEKYTELLNDASSIKGQVRDLKKQLAAMYLLSDEGATINSSNVAKRMVVEETKAMKSQIDKALSDGAISSVDVISKTTDIVWYSYKDDGGAGYQSVASLSEEEINTAIGKKPGDSIGEATIDSIYALVEKPAKDSTKTPEAQDGQTQSTDQTTTTSSSQPQSGNDQSPTT